MQTGRLTLSLCIFLLVCGMNPINAQQGRKHIREGNRQYNQENYPQSELEYRKALEMNKGSVEGLFNLGTAMYRQEKFDEAAKTFSRIPENLKDPLSAASFYHNLGNSLLQSQQVQESIEAYKQALRLNPADDETRYNLAYAQRLLNQQQQQESQDQNQQQDKDEQKEQDKQENERQQQDQNPENQQNKEQQPDRTERISREDAERLLQAVENEEKNVQDKLKREQAIDNRVRILRNW